jgi:hypothetical protein
VARRPIQELNGHVDELDLHELLLRLGGIRGAARLRRLDRDGAAPAIALWARDKILKH